MSRLIEQIDRNAVRAFKDHEITVRLDQEGPFRSYRCQRPGSWTYGFDVTFTPGWVFISGDIGHLAISRLPDMMEFLRGTLAKGGIDFRYVAEKVPNCIATREWSEEAAHELIERICDSEEIAYEKRLELQEFGSDEGTWEHETIPALFDLGVNEWYEYGDANDWTPHFLWNVFALRWFVQKMDAAVAQQSA